LGTTLAENAASIERSRRLGKRFSQGPAVGFYASGDDRKMTEKRDFRSRAGETRCGPKRGQRRENRRVRTPGVADSQNHVSALARTLRIENRAAAIPKAVNSRDGATLGGPSMERRLEFDAVKLGEYMLKLILAATGLALMLAPVPALAQKQSCDAYCAKRCAGAPSKIHCTQKCVQKCILARSKK